MLTEPGHPRLGALGHIGELHGEPGDEDGLLDPVGPRVLDEHVARGQVGVVHDLVVGGDRSGDQSGGVEGFAGGAFGLAGGPGLDGGADVRLEVLEPPLRGGETRVVDPLRPSDGAGHVGPLMWAQDLEHEPAVGRGTRGGCRARGVPIGAPIDQKLGTTSTTATMASSMATSTRWARPVRSRSRSAAWVPITAKRAVTMSPRPPMGAPTGGWPSGRLNS